MYSKIEHKTKHRMCKFFVVLGNGPALMGMPDIDALNIINIYSIGTEHIGGSDNCCTNSAASESTDMMQETDRTENCYTNTDSISKSDNTDKPMVNNKLSNTKDYFLLGPNCDSDKKASAEIKEILKMLLMELGALMAHFCCG